MKAMTGLGQTETHHEIDVAAVHPQVADINEKSHDCRVGPTGDLYPANP
jgi:hypothetical protein